MKNILITGAKGFIGKNLTASFKEFKDKNLFLNDIEDSLDTLKEYVQSADIIFHLAGINRPKEESEFTTGNLGSLEQVINFCECNDKKIPIVLTSSIQADYDNPYGVSKKQAEEALISYGMRNNVKVYIYRLKNVFGKWCRPNYNSGISTFTYNIANDLPITVSSKDNVVNLVYIDDIIDEFINLLDRQNVDIEKYYHEIAISYSKTLGEIVDTLNKIKDSRNDLTLPDMKDGFEKKLYSTFLSYLPKDKFSYDLKMNVDNRGSFTEFIRTENKGQVSVNISKAGITKGNHWHHTKTEKFLVVSGKGAIRFRDINSEEIIEYLVSGEKLEVVDIPPGYTHNISNLGDKDMVTVMWANEAFDPEKPDTFYLEV
ncbi:MAG: NAD-dependent epimerase/dehydratase family protein [Candidatus Delongbacteria bacterium]|jgi:UDP-2-acetamido-2,6-beta-L-arabino-hexul-4-ose reductase|nr:NAD-dependent epimerase/dehydratase family protein [Candidatus Delongbacteria bacterium]